MPDSDQIAAGYVTCSVCNRIVEAGHVNRAGRCMFCAGQPVKELAAQALGLSAEEAQTVTVEPPPESKDAPSEDADQAAARHAAHAAHAAQAEKAP